MKMAQIVFGKGTFNKKSQIKSMGFAWLPDDKAWVRIVSFDESAADLREIENRIAEMADVELHVTMADPFIGTVIDPLARRGKRGSGYDWRSEIKKTEAPKAPAGPITEINVNCPEHPAHLAKIGDVIEIKAWQAKSIQKKMGMDFFWRNLEIVEIVEDKPKSFCAKVKFSAKIANHCHVCGRTLDCEISRATGIGPVCCKKVGIERPKKKQASEILAELAEVSEKIGVLGPVWISKRSVVTDDQSLDEETA